ncbi:aa3-type cytochrome c oxidase subunit IV [Sphingomonas sp. NBWT7]|nr:MULTISPECIES: aa3-type cytochrome c oxidase subunit IV [unclassified Sphingomonas]QNE31605.1 aa3-type cytochrome c oxidase subunit IV [Sphingomonas sp. NBWT7]
MADHGAQSNDIKAHAATYEGVMGLMKWGTVACVIVAAFVVWLIA